MLSRFNFTLADVSEILALILAVGAVTWFWIEQRGSKVFAAKESVTTLRKDFDERLTNVDGRMEAFASDISGLQADIRRMPSHREFTTLGNRIAEVEKNVAVVAAQIGGVKDVIDKIESQVGLLVRHQLQKEGQ